MDVMSKNFAFFSEIWIFNRFQLLTFFGNYWMEGFQNATNEQHVKEYFINEIL